MSHLHKLLVDTPRGTQEVILVGEGGGYFDPYRVLWDERTDGPLPADIVVGGMILDGDLLIYDQSRMDVHIATTISVPQVVTMRQARRALLAAGHLTTINAAVGSMDAAAQIDWEFAAEVHRNNTLVAAMQAALGLTDQQVDELFVAAGTIE